VRHRETHDRTPSPAHMLSTPRYRCGSRAQMAGATRRKSVGPRWHPWGRTPSLIHCHVAVTMRGRPPPRHALHDAAPHPGRGKAALRARARGPRAARCAVWRRRATRFGPFSARGCLFRTFCTQMLAWCGVWEQYSWARGRPRGGAHSPPPIPSPPHPMCVSSL
jgi:hypothetical protein